MFELQCEFLPKRTFKIATASLIVENNKSRVIELSSYRVIELSSYRVMYVTPQKKVASTTGLTAVFETLIVKLDLQ